MKDGYAVAKAGDGIGMVGSWFREVDRIAGRQMVGQDLRVVKTRGERLENLLEVAGVLHDLVELFKHVFELFVDRNQNMGMLVLVLDDAQLIGVDISLHLFIL